MSDLELLQAAIEAIVDRKVAEKVESALAARGGAPAREAAAPLLTPTEASRRLGGRPSAQAIAEMVKSGRLPHRLNNLRPNPRRPNYLVRLEEVEAALEARGELAKPPAPVDLRAKAAEFASRAARRGRG